VYAASRFAFLKRLSHSRFISECQEYMRNNNIEQILKHEKLGFDIDQRDKIIKNYEKLGSIDINNAIDMIVSLRNTDPIFMAVTCIDQMPSNESDLLIDSTIII